MYTGSCGEDLEEDLLPQPISSAFSDDDIPHIEETQPWLVSMKVRVPVNICHIINHGNAELGNDAMAILDKEWVSSICCKHTYQDDSDP